MTRTRGKIGVELVMRHRMIITPIGMGIETKTSAYERELKKTLRFTPDVKGIQRLLSSPTLQLLISMAGTIKAYMAKMKSHIGKEFPALLVAMLITKTMI